MKACHIHTLLRLVSWSLVVGLATGSAGMAAPPAAGFVLVQGRTTLRFNAQGALVAWTGQWAHQAGAQSVSAGEVRYGTRTLPLDRPTVAGAADGLRLDYHWADAPELEVSVHHRLRRERGVVLWTRELRVQGPAALASDLTITVQSWPQGLPSNTWLPRLDGTGGALGTNGAAAFRFAGAVPGAGVLLAVPMVSLPAAGGVGRVLVAADPSFSTRFEANILEWTYPAAGGLERGGETRTIVVAVHPGTVEDSLGDFFRYLLPDVSPGPAWLHEIALVDFDYLSDGGQGWFRDVEALAGSLPKRDRRRVFLCLHGWYDFLGRYCFDPRTGALDRRWTAFSSYALARQAPEYGTIGGKRVKMGFAECKPVELSLAAVHERLRHARERGFRAGLYFADGLNAGADLVGFDPARVLRWGGWQGPDSKGRSYIQNQLAPEVRRFFLSYAQALLAEFGPDLDALVWDETFHVACGQLGTAAWPGYADRAMMRLVREITALVEAYNREHGRQIAFLTSDCLGAFGQELIGPYALVSHGTYQDSWCQPRAWSYGLFANYRNVLWSCCWWPITHWDWVEFGVHEYQAPVAISNGWGDDRGFAEMTPAERARVLELFAWRKQRPTRLRWFTTLPPEPAPGG